MRFVSLYNQCVCAHTQHCHLHILFFMCYQSYSEPNCHHLSPSLTRSLFYSIVLMPPPHHSNSSRVFLNACSSSRKGYNGKIAAPTFLPSDTSRLKVCAAFMESMDSTMMPLFRKYWCTSRGRRWGACAPPPTNKHSMVGKI